MLTKSQINKLVKYRRRAELYNEMLAGLVEFVDDIVGDEDLARSYIYELCNLDELLSEVSKQAEMVTCFYCNGKGLLKTYKPKLFARCPNCNGIGTMPSPGHVHRFVLDEDHPSWESCECGEVRCSSAADRKAHNG